MIFYDIFLIDFSSILIYFRSFLIDKWLSDRDSNFRFSRFSMKSQFCIYLKVFSSILIISDRIFKIWKTTKNQKSSSSSSSSSFHCCFLLLIFFKISKFDRKLSKSINIPSNTSKIDFSSKIPKIENSNLDQIITYRSKKIENNFKSMKNRSKIYHKIS